MISYISFYGPDDEKTHILRLMTNNQDDSTADENRKKREKLFNHLKQRKEKEYAELEAERVMIIIKYYNKGEKTLFKKEMWSNLFQAAETIALKALRDVLKFGGTVEKKVNFHATAYSDFQSPYYSYKTVEIMNEAVKKMANLFAKYYAKDPERLGNSHAVGRIRYFIQQRYMNITYALISNFASQLQGKRG